MSSGLLTLVLLFNGGTANAEDPAPQSTTLIVPDPMPSDTSTVTIQIVQDKVIAAQTALSDSASSNGQALLNTIQAHFFIIYYFIIRGQELITLIKN